MLSDCVRARSVSSFAGCARCSVARYIKLFTLRPQASQHCRNISRFPILLSSLLSLSLILCADFHIQRFVIKGLAERETDEVASGGADV